MWVRSQLGRLATRHKTSSYFEFSEPTIISKSCFKIVLWLFLSYSLFSTKKSSVSTRLDKNEQTLLKYWDSSNKFSQTHCTYLTALIYFTISLTTMRAELRQREELCGNLTNLYTCAILLDLFYKKCIAKNVQTMSIERSIVSSLHSRLKKQIKPCHRCGNVSFVCVVSIVMKQKNI